MITETHAHYDDKAYDEDRDLILAEMLGENGTVDRIVNSGADLATSRNSLGLAERYPHIYASVGFHPDESGEFYGVEEEYEKMLSHEKCVAVGEIGLDYHWDKWPHETQKDVFLKQWELALKYDKPIVIHSRDAAEDTLTIVKDMCEKIKASGKQVRADMHCYSYSLEHAREYLKYGFYFGVGGVVTFKNARKLQEVVAEIPLQNMLLETDSPYLTPEPFRRNRNQSSYIAYVAEKIAEIKGISVDEVYRVTSGNAERFFGF